MSYFSCFFYWRIWGRIFQGLLLRIVVDGDRHQALFAENGKVIGFLLGAPAAVLEVVDGERLEIEAEAAVDLVTIPNTRMLEFESAQRCAVGPDDEFAVVEAHIGIDVSGHPHSPYVHLNL